MIDGDDPLDVRNEVPRRDDGAQFLKGQAQSLIGADMRHAGGAAGGKILKDHGIAKGAGWFAVLGAEGARG